MPAVAAAATATSAAPVAVKQRKVELQWSICAHGNSTPSRRELATDEAIACRIGPLEKTVKLREQEIQRLKSKLADGSREAKIHALRRQVLDLQETLAVLRGKQDAVRHSRSWIMTEHTLASTQLVAWISGHTWGVGAGWTASIISSVSKRCGKRACSDMEFDTGTCRAGCRAGCMLSPQQSNIHTICRAGRRPGCICYTDKHAIPAVLC